MTRHLKQPKTKLGMGTVLTYICTYAHTYAQTHRKSQILMLLPAQKYNCWHKVIDQVYLVVINLNLISLKKFTQKMVGHMRPFFDLLPTDKLTDRQSDISIAIILLIVRFRWWQQAYWIYRFKCCNSIMLHIICFIK